ncbi:ZrgA family zinc uptake protein [Marinobacter sp.]|uniref:ZrgA family zinc uptake protein n=1 Tax=Marinobacter sp. TaxID=50741 RepID=UPI003566B802
MGISTARNFTFTVAALLLPVTGFGQDGQSAHVHGAAQLQVAIEDNTAELILRSPAANLLGFEHAPRGPEQEKVRHEAHQWLETNALIQTPANDCTVSAGSIHQMGGTGHDHGHDHDHDHGDSPKENGHSDFEVTQRLNCGSELSGTLTVPLMERFPGIDSLSVDWITPNGQGHSELDAGETALTLSR